MTSNKFVTLISVSSIRTSLNPTTSRSPSKLSSKANSTLKEKSYKESSSQRLRKFRNCKRLSMSSMLPDMKRMSNSKRRSRNTKRQQLSSLKPVDFSSPSPALLLQEHSLKRRPIRMVSHPNNSIPKLSPSSKRASMRVLVELTSSSTERAMPNSSRS